MALEDQVAALVTSTTALTSAVNVQKVTLDTAVTNATTAATTATTKAGEASTSATNAATASTNATAQASTASTQATNAATSAAAAATAAAASGAVTFYATKAAADSGFAGLAANAIVRVFVDETKGYGSTWYKKVGSAFEFQMADTQLGTNPEQAPANYMLGSCAYLNQTWRHADLTIDPPSIANASEWVSTQTVPGVVLGDFALVSTSIDTLGVYVDVRVSGTDTVKIHYRNLSGASVDLASHTVSVRVMAKTPE